MKRSYLIILAVSVALVGIMVAMGTNAIPIPIKTGFTVTCNIKVSSYSVLGLKIDSYGCVRGNTCMLGLALPYSFWQMGVVSDEGTLRLTMGAYSKATQTGTVYIMLPKVYKISLCTDSAQGTIDLLASNGQYFDSKQVGV